LELRKAIVCTGEWEEFNENYLQVRNDIEIKDNANYMKRLEKIDDDPFSSSSDFRNNFLFSNYSNIMRKVQGS
jgi:hypothetical protein